MASIDEKDFGFIPETGTIPLLKQLDYVLQVQDTPVVSTVRSRRRILVYESLLREKKEVSKMQNEKEMIDFVKPQDLLRWSSTPKIRFWQTQKNIFCNFIKTAG